MISISRLGHGTVMIGVTGFFSYGAHSVAEHDAVAEKDAKP